VGGLPGDVYIRHPAEASLSSLIGHKGGQYVVVVGPRGCGKSTLVQHTIASSPIGVIPVSMNKNFTDLYGAISRKIGSTGHDWDIDYMKTLFNDTILQSLARNLAQPSRSQSLGIHSIKIGSRK
jgi:energy-coupling factor transporter ATP-binding protein EcfA2